MGRKSSNSRSHTSDKPGVIIESDISPSTYIDGIGCRLRPAVLVGMFCYLLRIGWFQTVVVLLISWPF